MPAICGRGEFARICITLSTDIPYTIAPFPRIFFEDINELSMYAQRLLEPVDILHALREASQRGSYTSSNDVAIRYGSDKAPLLEFYTLKTLVLSAYADMALA